MAANDQVSDISSYPKCRSSALSLTAERLLRQRLAQFSGSPDDAVAFIQQHSHLSRNGFSSLFLSSNGTVHVIRPHSHLATAYSILSECGLAPKDLNDAVDVLTRATGVLRAQILNGGIGVGVEVHLEAPPTQAQIVALKGLYGSTSMERFVADVFLRNEQMDPADSIVELVEVVGARTSLGWTGPPA